MRAIAISALHTALLFSLCIACPAYVPAAAINPGDIVAIEQDAWEPFGDFVVAIDSISGVKTSISGPLVGSGPNISAVGIAANSSGVIFTAGSYFTPAQVLRIDPATGNRTPIYQETNGSPDFGNGPAINDPIGILLEPDGGVVVAGSNQVVRIDPVTLDRTTISGATHGSGPWSNDFHTGMALDPDGNIILASYGTATILRINRLTGDREIVSDNSTGDGPILGMITGLVVEAEGSIVVSNQNPPALYRINPATGDRTVLSDATTGNGYWADQPWGLAIDLVGNIIYKDSNDIHRVDPLTGDRTTIQSVSGSTGICVVPAAVPEPSTLALAAIGAFGIVILAARHRRSE